MGDDEMIVCDQYYVVGVVDVCFGEVGKQVVVQDVLVVVEYGDDFVFCV